MKQAKGRKIEIVQNGDPILRKISSPIPEDKIKSPDIKSLISDLKQATEGQADAVAIAAVQIGKPVRLFLISKRAFELVEPSKAKKDMVFINPKIVKTSKTKQALEEGCLSVKYYYGQVMRSEKTTVEGLDENGKKISRGFSGLLSQIVQHEMDHLNGGLFIDKAKNVMKISEEEYEKSLKEAI